MDFYFTEKQKAVRFIDFLESHVPTKVTSGVRRYILMFCETRRLSQYNRTVIEFYLYIGQVLEKAYFCGPFCQYRRVQTQLHRRAGATLQGTLSYYLDVT